MLFGLFPRAHCRWSVCDDETRSNAQEKRATVNQMLGGGSGGGSADSLKPADVAARKARCGLPRLRRPAGLNRPFGFRCAFLCHCGPPIV